MVMNDLDKLVAEFARSVRAQNEAIARHDPVEGNKFAQSYFSAAKALVAHGAEGINAFACLLADPCIDVRTMAAAFLIPFKTNESKIVLELSSQGIGIIALGAKMALQRWETERKGIKGVGNY
jgi:hypothetical protein